MRLKEKVALVTGSSRGIGRAIALTFAREGADIVVNYSSDEEAAKQTFDSVKDVGRRAILGKADVSSKAAVDAMISDVISKFDRVDILVNNAGIIRRDSIQSLREDEWARIMAVNLNGALNCIKAVSQYMIENKYGKIINIASIAGFVTKSKSGLAYVASKSALIGLTKKLAMELGSYGINVNAVAPGVIMTEQSLGTSREEVESLIETARQTALGRAGQPQDVANAALFLASDESNFITGQVIVVDGGRTDFFSHA